MESELPDRQHRAARELPADQENQRHHSERHPEGEPFEGSVAEPRRRRHLGDRFCSAAAGNGSD